MQTTILSEVTNGRLSRPANDMLLRALAGLDGKRVVLTVQRFVKRRSSNQNRFFYGPFLASFRAMFCEAGQDITLEQAKDILKARFGVMDEITTPDGEVIQVPKSTAKYSTVEFEEVMEKTRAWAADYGVLLPFPNEQWEVANG